MTKKDDKVEKRDSDFVTLKFMCQTCWPSFLWPLLYIDYNHWNILYIMIFLESRNLVGKNLDGGFIYNGLKISLLCYRLMHFHVFWNMYTSVQ